MARKKKKKTNFLQKKPMDGAVNRVGQGVATGTTTIGLMALSNNTQKLAGKYHGPIIGGLGLIGKVFIANPWGQSVSDGMISAGMLISAKEYAPGKFLDTVGLGAPEGKVIDTKPKWEKLAKEVEEARKNIDIPEDTDFPDKVDPDKVKVEPEEEDIKQLNAGMMDAQERQAIIDGVAG